MGNILPHNNTFWDILHLIHWIHNSKSHWDYSNMHNYLELNSQTYQITINNISSKPRRKHNFGMSYEFIRKTTFFINQLLMKSIEISDTMKLLWNGRFRCKHKYLKIILLWITCKLKYDKLVRYEEDFCVRILLNNSACIHQTERSCRRSSSKNKKLKLLEINY